MGKFSLKTSDFYSRYHLDIPIIIITQKLFFLRKINKTYIVYITRLVNLLEDHIKGFD